MRLDRSPEARGQRRIPYARMDQSRVQADGCQFELLWSPVELTSLQMLSGCDYLPSIPGVGLKTAHRLLRRHKTVEKVSFDRDFEEYKLLTVISGPADSPTRGNSQHPTNLSDAIRSSRTRLRLSTSVLPKKEDAGPAQ